MKCLWYKKTEEKHTNKNRVEIMNCNRYLGNTLRKFKIDKYNFN